MKTNLYDLNKSALENCELAILAKQAGYASLRAMANELSMWGCTNDEVELFLREQISNPNTY